jgi:short-subunit dehydrogenase
LSDQRGELSPQEKPWVAITGSSSGIGRSAAKYLAKRGFGVVVASEQYDANREVREEIVADGGRAEVVDLDLLDPESVKSFSERVNDKVGFCEVLVNNAGIGLHKTLEESTDQEFRRTFEVNFFSLTELCRQAVAYMKEAGGGQIINISSASARRSLAQMSCYGATKGAVHCFSQALRLEVAQYGIAVTEILPISVRTEFFDRAGYQPKGLVQTPETIARLIERAMRTKEAELCSSQMTRLGFLLDLVAPNFTSWILEWHQKRRG